MASLLLEMRSKDKIRSNDDGKLAIAG